MAKALARDFRRPTGPGRIGTGARVMSLELERRRAWERGQAIAAHLLRQMSENLQKEPQKQKKKSK